MLGNPGDNSDVASLIPVCNLTTGVTITQAADGTYSATSNGPATFDTFGRTECPGLPVGTVVVTFSGSASPYAGGYPTYDDKTCALLGNTKVSVEQGTRDGKPFLSITGGSGYFVELDWLG